MSLACRRGDFTMESRERRTLYLPRDVDERIAELTAPMAENVSPAMTSETSRVSVELRTGVTTNDATRQRF
jgi:hypothetical protein